MFTSIRHIMLASAIAGCAALNSYAQNPAYPATGTDATSPATSQSQAKSDKKATLFLKEAVKHNQQEVAMVEVAVRKAQNQELKSLAQQLQQDHTQASQQLQTLAQTHGVKSAEKMAQKASDEIAELNKEQSGAKWDQKFATEVLKGHADGIQKYNTASKDIQAQDVKQFIQAQLPKLHQHFQKAQEVARTVGVDQSTIASYASKVPAMGGTGEDTQSQPGTGASTNAHGAHQPSTPPTQ